MSKVKKILFIMLVIAVIGMLALSIAVAGRARRGVRYVYRDDGGTEVSQNGADRCNILFLGTDREAGLCDVMMLVGIDFTEGRTTVVQIPRDTYAAYTDASYKKLNGAYASLGGAEQTAQFMGDAFGIEIDHYVCIGLDTLGAIVDAVGGVDVELPCDMMYSDPAQDLYINMKKGVQHLDGRLAEQFVRFRSAYANGDLGRIDAQKLFLAALFEKISEDFSPVLAAKLASAVDGVETDLGVTDMISIGTRVLQMSADDIAMLTLPGADVVATQSGASYYTISSLASKEIMKEYFGASGEFDADEKFLNPRYDSFKEIYFGYTEYSVLPVTDVAKNGVDLEIG